MISPLHVATAGYLDSPLSVSVHGYLAFTEIESQKPKGGGGGKGKRRAVPSRLAAMQSRDDEDLIPILMAAMEIIRWLR